MTNEQRNLGGKLKIDDCICRIINTVTFICEITIYCFVIIRKIVKIRRHFSFTGYCTEYNEVGSVIQAHHNLKCTDVTPPCASSYLSTEAYLCKIFSVLFHFLAFFLVLVFTLSPRCFLSPAAARSGDKKMPGIRPCVRFSVSPTFLKRSLAYKF